MRIVDLRNQIDKTREEYINQLKKQQLIDYVNDGLKSLKWYQKLFSVFSKNHKYVSNFVANADRLVAEWNEDYVQRMMLDHKNFFSDVEGKALDEQQQRAVLTDECANLVIAGAGSGKTLTIASKVKFLCEIKNVDPKEILLLSFTNKAANEMTERIVNGMGINVRASTFHSLGRRIISWANQKSPSVEDNPERLVLQYFRSLEDDDLIAKVLQFVGTYYIDLDKRQSGEENIKTSKNLLALRRTLKALCQPPIYDEEIDAIKDALEVVGVEEEEYTHRKLRALIEKKLTVANEQVKSLEEVRIANYLFLHGVEYEYERHYPYDPEDNNRKQYRPDFYLPEYDIYWEHFGIDENGRVPWLSNIEEQKYLDGIGWKRALHKRHGTKLIETYSYMMKSDDFETVLSNILRENGVEEKNVDFKQLYLAMSKEKYYGAMDKFIKLMSTFLGLFKSDGYELSKFDDFLQLEDNTERDRYFLEIARDCYIYYQNELMRLNKIDFNDMINMATSILRDSSIEKRWKYIIVDEYQDISVSRYQLLHELFVTMHPILLCVGDDWQSIYRFSGSDIDLFTSFEKYWGKSELMRIEQTYRNSQELIDAASSFIMKNPAQMEKRLRSDKHYTAPYILVPYYTNPEDEKHNVSMGDALELSLNKIDEISNGKDIKVLILGRHGFDKNTFLFLDPRAKKPECDPRYSLENDEIIISERHPNLSIQYSTVHKAKGLEADYTIIINLTDSVYGFPNQLSDDRVLRFVLSNMDSYMHSEERRLFYVALTRTKNAVFLLQPLFMESAFLNEIITDASEESNYVKIVHDNLISEIERAPECPRCKTGKLIRKTGPYGEFAGCSNYPVCDYTIRTTSVLSNPIRCPECGGYMVTRTGPYGNFWGCVNYPLCKHTRQIDTIKTKWQ